MLVGLFFRATFTGLLDQRIATYVSIMTIAFLLGAPVAMGYWSVAEYLRTTPADRICWRVWLYLPWLSVLVTILLSVLFGWEGRICILFAAPIMLIGSLLGGVAARIVWQRIGNRFSDRITVLALPLLLFALEAQIPAPPEFRTVKTAILIHAPSETVWNNIKSVPLIRADELPRSWIERAGFPKPLAATLSRDGVGGVRQASFTGGLLFTETVNEWTPGTDLRFSIHANTTSIPPSTLDEHVRVGGPFFDVLEGEYQLEKRPDGVLLHLTSTERLSTHFNSYAGEWTDAVMRAIQEQILFVIRRRCESSAG